MVEPSPPTGQPTEACCPRLNVAPLPEREATELARSLKALADPARLRLLSLIASAPSGEVCACDLPGALGRTQSTVSHHLSLLVSSGLLTREQRGKWAWFKLSPSRLEELSRAIDPNR